MCPPSTGTDNFLSECIPHRTLPNRHNLLSILLGVFVSATMLSKNSRNLLITTVPRGIKCYATL